MKNRSLILMLSFSALTGNLCANAVEANLNSLEIHQKDQKFKQQWEENSSKKKALEDELRLLLQEQQENDAEDAIIEPSSYPNPAEIDSWEMPTPFLLHDEEDEDEELKRAIEASEDAQLEEAIKLSMSVNHEEEKKKDEKTRQKEEKKNLVKNILEFYLPQTTLLHEQYTKVLAERSKNIDFSSPSDEFQIRQSTSSELRDALKLMNSKIKKYLELVSLKSLDKLPKDAQRHGTKKLLEEKLRNSYSELENLREKIIEKEREISPAFAKYREMQDGPDREEARKIWLALSAEKNDLLLQAEKVEEEKNSRAHEYFNFVAKSSPPPEKEEEEVVSLPLNTHEEEKAEQQEDIVKTWKEEKSFLIKTILDDFHPKIIELWGQWRNITDELSKADEKRYLLGYGSEERNDADEKCRGLRAKKECTYSELSDTINRQKSEVDKYFSLVLEKSSKPKDEQRRERKKALAEKLHEVRSEAGTLQEKIWLFSIQERLAWNRYYIDPNRGRNTYEFLLGHSQNRPLAKGEICLEKEGDELKYKVIRPDQNRYAFLLSETEQPEENKVHLRTNNGILEYAVMTPHEGSVKEALDKNTYDDLMPQGLTLQILKIMEPQILEELFKRGHIYGTIIEGSLDIEINGDLTLENLTDDVKRQILKKMSTTGHIQDPKETWCDLSNKKSALQLQLNETLEKEGFMIADYFTFVRDGKISRS